MAKIYGYARVSTEDQNLDRQIDALASAGVAPENIYKEKISGTKRKRPELIRLLNDISEGDTLIISDLTRISRSSRDLLNIVDSIKQKNATIKSLKDEWLDTTSDNPYNAFLLSVMSGLAQLERDLISQRTKEGLKSAKARGRYGGRPKGRTEKSQTVLTLYKNGVRVSEIATSCNISRTTVWRIIKDNERNAS